MNISSYWNQQPADFLFSSRVLQNLSQINIVNSQNSLSDLMAAAHVQQAATWQLYGKE